MMKNALSKEGLSALIADVDLYEGGELQLIIGESAYCVYRMKTHDEQYSYYIADADHVAGPSGRKHVTRRTWNKRPLESEVSVTLFLAKTNEALVDGEVEEVWICNVVHEWESRLDMNHLNVAGYMEEVNDVGEDFIVEDESDAQTTGSGDVIFSAETKRICAAADAHIKQSNNIKSIKNPLA